MPENTPTKDEINAVLEACLVAEEEASTAYPGMTYEQGVYSAISWMQGNASNPIFES